MNDTLPRATTGSPALRAALVSMGDDRVDLLLERIIGLHRPIGA